MHTIRYQTITHRRNNAGEWKQTVENEYYLNEPEDGEVLYRIKGSQKEPIVFRHGSKEQKGKSQTEDNNAFQEQEVSTDNGKYIVRKEGEEYVKDVYDTQGRLIETIRCLPNGDFRRLVYLADGNIEEFCRKRVDKEM